MLKPKSLQQRLIFFLLAPLAVLMLGIGTAVFVHATAGMLNVWREAAVLRLARAAHYVDMDLSRAKRLVRMYHDAAQASQSREVREWIMGQLKEMDGIERVDITWSNDDDPYNEPHPLEVDGNNGGLQAYPADPNQSHAHSRFEIVPPRYGSPTGHQTATLISEIKNEEHKTIGKIEVVIRLHDLTENITDSGWRQSDTAFLVDNDGRIITCTTSNHQKTRLGDGPLEIATLRAIKDRRFGTVLAGGYPPDEVSGFFRLREAPWSLVVIAPGREILTPVIHFGIFFAVAGVGSMLLILVLIRTITGPSISTIKEVSGAANRVAQGHYDDLPAVKSHDEVGQLVESFNSMVRQLEERMKLKEAMHVAMEVQQSLLPRRAPEVSGLDIAGRSIYCDETGGDYYDFIPLPEMGESTVGIAVGDVVGHGIGAALLMTTVRAFLHSQASKPGGLSCMISEVNRLLCADTRETNSFATLFFTAVDPDERKIHWVRAGHDPALIYSPSSDAFEELRGEGIALGVDDEYVFPEYTFSDWADGQIMVIGTDGIWETENPRSEPFGKARLKEIIRRNSHLSAQEMVRAISDELAAFRRTEPQRDDATMVVVKILHTEGKDSR